MMGHSWIQLAMATMCCFSLGVVALEGGLKGGGVISVGYLLVSPTPA